MTSEPEAERLVSDGRWGWGKQDVLCRVVVYRREGGEGWAIFPDPRIDNAGEALLWVGDMITWYLRHKRHPRTGHEVHLLLHGLMGSLPDEVEVVFDDYGVPPMRRSDMVHAANWVNWGPMEGQASDVQGYKEYLDGVDMATEREKKSSGAH